MKKLLLILTAAMIAVVKIGAQNPQPGSVYHIANLLAEDMKEIAKEAKKEKMDGAEAIMAAITAKMTVKFIDDKTVDMSTTITFDEKKAKENGAPWLYRKMAKMKLKQGKSAGITTYTANGRKLTIISVKEKKPMSFELSEDGKTLTYLNQGSKYNLKRIK
jgi:hypothetical protein